MKKTTTNKQYGLLSLVSIIVGTVIGSGIYIKNNSLMQQTNSSILTVIAWLLGGLIVVSILISFFEIAEITTNNNKQQTMSNYGKSMFNEQTGRIIGMYYIFMYFPFVIASKAIYGAEKIIGQIPYFVSGSGSGFFSWAMITFFALIFVSLGTTLIIYSVKGTKKTMFFGTLIKTIPLFLVIFFTILILSGVIIGNVDSVNHIFDPEAKINSGLHENDALLNTLLILPPMMFAFDGFLFTNSLSKEAKSEKTLKQAAIISMFMITMIYLLFSISTLLIGKGSYGVADVMGELFPHSEWLIQITISIIIISIISSMIGSNLQGTWTVAGSSKDYDLPDHQGELIKRQKNGIPKKAVVLLFLGMIGWLIFLRGFDLLYYLTNVNDGLNTNGTNYLTNLGAITNFAIYSLLILGGVINRFTKKQPHGKSKLFLPFAFIAIALVSLVVFAGFYDVFSGFSNSNISLQEAILNFVIFLSFYLFFIGINIINESLIKHNNPSSQREKVVYAYTNKVEWKWYEKVY